MALTLSEKRDARKFARSFAAGLVQNAEIEFRMNSGLNPEQEDEANAELQRIAKRIESSIKHGSP